MLNTCDGRRRDGGLDKGGAGGGCVGRRRGALLSRWMGLVTEDERPQKGAALRSGLLTILLCASCPQPGEAVAINRTLPSEEFLDRQHVAAARVFERKESATTSALRRITQRVVPSAGRSAIVSGLPSGPITYLSLGWWGSVMLFSHGEDKKDTELTCMCPLI